MQTGFWLKPLTGTSVGKHRRAQTTKRLLGWCELHPSGPVVGSSARQYLFRSAVSVITATVCSPHSRFIKRLILNMSLLRHCYSIRHMFSCNFHIGVVEGIVGGGRGVALDLNCIPQPLITPIAQGRFIMTELRPISRYPPLFFC